MTPYRLILLWQERWKVPCLSEELNFHHTPISQGKNWDDDIVSAISNNGITHGRQLVP